MSFEWPEKKSFISSFSCKSFTRAGPSKFYSAFVGPVWNLMPMPGQFLVAAVCWATLYGLYYIFAELTPINKLNSTDGRYVNLTVCWITAASIYYILSFVIIYITYEKGCDSLFEQAENFLYTSPSILPSTLSSSAWPLDPDELQGFKSAAKAAST